MAMTRNSEGDEFSFESEDDLYEDEDEKEEVDMFDQLADIHKNQSQNFRFQSEMGALKVHKAKNKISKDQKDSKQTFTKMSTMSDPKSKIQAMRRGTALDKPSNLLLEDKQ